MEKQQGKSGRSLGPWVSETLALIFAILCLAALAVLLGLYNGKPVFGWNGVTLNTIVSILSTASKSALMLALCESISQWKWILFTSERRPLIDFERIDSASHGPLGSLSILWHCKGAAFLRIGAITTLLALAVDPFAQQLIQFKQNLDFTFDSNTTVARAGRYSLGTKVNMALMLDPSRNPPTPNTQADADFSMQSAVLYGLSQSLENTIQQLPYNCPSGNCTWPAYESLSICSRCNDLASSVEQLSDMGAQYVTLMTDNNAVSISNGTAFRLPNGLFIDNQDSWQWGASSNGAMMMTTYGTGNASKTVSMQDLDTLIWSLGILKVSPNPTNDTAEWPDLPVSATECALYYCVNRYDTTVRNGTLHETATPVADAKRAVDSWQPVDFPESWRALNDTMLASIEFDEYFSCIERSDLVLEAPDGERFNVSQNAVDSISAYFKSTFETSLRSYNETNHTVEGQINGWYMNSTTIQYKPSAIQPFYKSDDLNATFKTLATSMTNALRSDADSNGVGSNSPQQAGETGRVVTYYRIRWPWIALHCAVVVGAAVFLGLTIWESGGPGGEVPVWKSSSLAAMSRGGHVAELLDGAESVEEMEERARKGQVVLFGKDGEIMRGGGGTTAYERSG